jgi:hypothetical protein
MTIPRSVDDILAHADALAKRFEHYEPRPEDERDPAAVIALRDAVLARSDAERRMRDAVMQARQQGMSWTMIGTPVGTSGEAARQKFRDAA